MGEADKNDKPENIWEDAEEPVSFCKKFVVITLINRLNLHKTNL